MAEIASYHPRLTRIAGFNSDVYTFDGQLVGVLRLDGGGEFHFDTAAAARELAKAATDLANKMQIWEQEQKQAAPASDES